MSEQEPKKAVSLSKNLFVLVALPGAIGGLITWMMGNQVALVQSMQGYSLPVTVLLGMVSAFVLVIVLSNTTRDDIPRLIILSLLAGMAYEPIVKNGLLSIGVTEQDSALLLEEKDMEIDVLHNIPDLISSITDKVTKLGSAAVLDPEAPEFADIKEALQAMAVDLQTFNEQRKLELVRPLLAQLMDNLPGKSVFLVGLFTASGLPVPADLIEAQPSLASVTHDQIVTVGNVEHPLLPAGDSGYTEYTVQLRVDYFAEYVINVTSTDPERVDLYAELYDVDGNLVTYDDDSGGYPNPELSSYLGEGTYYLRITGYNGQSFSNAGFTFKERDPYDYSSESYTFEDGSVVPIAGLSSHTRRIQFEIITAGTYQLALTANESTREGDAPNDLVADVYDFKGNLVARDDDSGGNGNPLLQVALEPGSYFLDVYNFDQISYLYGFTITVTLEPAANNSQTQ